MAELTKQRVKEIAAGLYEHPERDPLVFEAFLTSESYDSLFLEPVDAYFGVAIKEEWRAGDGNNVVAMGCLKGSEELLLNKMITVVEEHLDDEQFDVITLCQGLGLSKLILNRKIKVLRYLLPKELIKNVRQKHAFQMMEKDKAISVSEVAFATGFSNLRYFSTCFKADFGISLSEFQESTGSESDK